MIEKIIKNSKLNDNNLEYNIIKKIIIYLTKY